MGDRSDFEAFDRRLDDLGFRIAALRTARECSPEHALATLDAALVELEVAERELRDHREELARGADRPGDRSTDRERRVLRAVFQDLPVPVFVLDRGGSIRRANRGAADLLATAAAYVTGKPLSLFVDLSHRAAFRSHLSAMLRDGGVTSFDTRLVRQTRSADVRLHLLRLDLPSETRPLVAAVVTPYVAAGPDLPDVSAGPRHHDNIGDEQVLVAAARRLDLLARTTRLLLHEDSLNEPVALGRAARMLQGEFADWALIDLVRDNEVQRAVVAGPDDVDGRSGTSLLGELDPTASEIPGDVIEAGASLLHPLIESEEALGVTEGGLPVLAALHAGSVLCVPLRDDAGVLGALTLVRRSGRSGFGLADLGLLEEVGEHLGLAIRTERSYQRRSEVARALQASLLPRTLPTVPGLELAATYRAATKGVEVGGDFYDVFDSPGGCGLVLGDVCGKGEEAAAITAMVRYGVRLLGLWNDRPADVLRQVNHAMVVQQETGRFATVVAAHVRWCEGRLIVRLASAGHPWPIVLRAGGGVHLVQGGGLPLGVFDDAEPYAQELELCPGDTLLLYSDGVTEARSPDGQLYGEQGLAGAVARGVGLTASAFVKAVENDLDQYTGGSIRDDMALLAVRAEAG